MDRKHRLNSKIGRRALLKSSLVGGGAALAGSWFGSLIPNAAWAADVAAKYETPVVETESGKLRGVMQQGVHTFRGVPYGASTAGSSRFMAPRKPEPWTGVRDAFQNGPTAPQLGGPPNPLIVGHRAPTFESEDCLVVNVFTPNVSGKRPVMVWLHGGGYAGGAGSAHSFDGNYLARANDVVVVSVNHRLNVFGYLYLGGVGGEKYADSGNAGMLDVVAALQWTHDNIAHFGGDPGNVTLFGQSGGGAKVSTLLGMPATKGLIHKAIIESGSALKGVSRENANKTAETIAGEAEPPAEPGGRTATAFNGETAGGDRQSRPRSGRRRAFQFCARGGWQEFAARPLGSHRAGRLRRCACDHRVGEYGRHVLYAARFASVRTALLAGRGGTENAIDAALRRRGGKTHRGCIAKKRPMPTRASSSSWPWRFRGTQSSRPSANSRKAKRRYTCTSSPGKRRWKEGGGILRTPSSFLSYSIILRNSPTKWAMVPTCSRWRTE